MAPILYARANTVGAFTDVPMLMWYEMDPTSRGWQFRYSVDLLERRRRHRDRPADGDLGAHDGHRVSSTAWKSTNTTDSRGGISGSRPRGAAVQGPARRPASAAVGVDRQQHGQRVGYDADALCAGGRAIRPYQPVARSGDGSARLDLHRDGAGDDREGKIVEDDAPRDRGRFPTCAATSTSRPAPSSRTRRSPFRSERRTAPARRAGTTPIAASANSASCAAGVSGAPCRCRHRPDGRRRFGFARSPALAGTRPRRHRIGRVDRVNTVFTLDRQYQPGPSLFSWTRFDPAAG